MKLRFACTILAVAVLAVAQATSATAGLGLSGAVYPAGDSGSPVTLSGFSSFINGGATASVTFTSQMINGNGWSGGDNTPVQSFLGNSPGYDGYNAVGPGLGSNLYTSAVDLTGYLTVSVTGSYNFSTSTDDGSAFYLNGNGQSGSGTQLANNDGSHGVQNVNENYSLVAGTPYRIEYLYFNTEYNGNSGGAAANASITGPGSVSLSTPEPGSMVVWGLSGLGMFFVARRRRKA